MRNQTVKRILSAAVAMVLAVSMPAAVSAGESATEAPGSEEKILKTIPLHTEAQEDCMPAGETEEPEGVVPGTVFRYWTNADIPIYNPWTDSRGAALYNQIYDNLLVKYRGDYNEIRPNLASDYSVSEDGLTWTFNLRDDVTFSNGNPFSSADVIATWDILSQYQTRLFALVDSYEATGDYQVVVHLKAANPLFIFELPSQNFGISDHTLIEEFGAETNDTAVGTGPYYVESYEPGQKFVLKARENYWNKERQPHVETCELVILPDENTAMMSLMIGDIDCMNTLNTEVLTTLAEDGFPVILLEDREQPFWMNTTKVEAFQNIRVREALCHMIDWEGVSDLCSDGLWVHPNSYFTGEGETPYSEKYDYDPELGLKMLEEEGYKPEDIDFTILSDPDWTNMCVAVVGQFQNLGLTNIDTVTYDGATCFGMLRSAEYDCFPCFNGYDCCSPLNPFSMGMVKTGTQPVMFLDDEHYPEAEALYNKVNESVTLEEYYDNFHVLADYVQEQCLAFGGLQDIKGYSFTSRVHGAYLCPNFAELHFCHLWVED